MIAPVGINRLFTGGGDWRRLPFVEERLELCPCDDDDDGDEEDWAALLEAIEGARRCLFRYEVEETERGSDGLCVAEAEGGLSNDSLT